MAGAASDPRGRYDLPPGVALSDIEIDPELDAVDDSELGIEVRTASLASPPLTPRRSSRCSCATG